MACEIENIEDKINVPNLISDHDIMQLPTAAQVSIKKHDYSDIVNISQKEKDFYFKNKLTKLNDISVPKIGEDYLFKKMEKIVWLDMLMKMRTALLMGSARL